MACIPSSVLYIAVPKSLREITCPRPHHSTPAPWTCVGGFDSTQVFIVYFVSAVIRIFVMAKVRWGCGCIRIGISGVFSFVCFDTRSVRVRQCSEDTLYPNLHYNSPTCFIFSDDSHCLCGNHTERRCKYQ